MWCFIPILNLVAAGTLLFTKWEPGRVYVKNLVVKNIGAKLVKMKYTAPSPEGVFSIPLPPPSVPVSPGTSLTIKGWIRM